MSKYRELNKLKGRITEMGKTYRGLSEESGIPLNTLSNKINGHSLFDIVEVSVMCSLLDIPPEEIPIFSPSIAKRNKAKKGGVVRA